MKNPPHPGKIVRVCCLGPFGLDVTEGTKVLSVSRQALLNLVNCCARMAADMEVRLAKAFGSTTETWIRLQAAQDIAQMRTREKEIQLLRTCETAGATGSVGSPMIPAVQYEDVWPMEWRV